MKIIDIELTDGQSVHLTQKGCQPIVIYRVNDLVYVKDEMDEEFYAFFPETR